MQFTRQVTIPIAITIAFLPSSTVNSIPCRHVGRRKSGLRPIWGRKNLSENRFRFPDRRGRTKSQFSSVAPSWRRTVVREDWAWLRLLAVSLGRTLMGFVVVDPDVLCGAGEPVGQHGGGGLPREPWIGAFEPERQTF